MNDISAHKIAITNALTSVYTGRRPANLLLIKIVEPRCKTTHNGGIIASIMQKADVSCHLMMKEMRVVS